MSRRRMREDERIHSFCATVHRHTHTRTRKDMRMIETNERRARVSNQIDSHFQLSSDAMSPKASSFSSRFFLLAAFLWRGNGDGADGDNGTQKEIHMYALLLFLRLASAASLDFRVNSLLRFFAVLLAFAVGCS